jgi:hypothetical protein
VPRSISPSEAFMKAVVPPGVAWRFELQLLRTADPLYAMEYDLNSGRAFWISATVDEILLVVIPGISKDEAFVIRNHLAVADDRHKLDVLFSVAMAVTGCRFAVES